MLVALGQFQFDGVANKKALDDGQPQPDFGQFIKHVIDTHPLVDLARCATQIHYQLLNTRELSVVGQRGSISPSEHVYRRFHGAISPRFSYAKR